MREEGVSEGMDGWRTGVMEREMEVELEGGWDACRVGWMEVWTDGGMEGGRREGREGVRREVVGRIEREHD